MESIPQERAEFRAAKTAKDSANRGDETKAAIAECSDGEAGSSIIQPRPACPEAGFQAASVNTGHSPT